MQVPQRKGGLPATVCPLDDHGGVYRDIWTRSVFHEAVPSRKGVALHASL